MSNITPTNAASASTNSIATPLDIIDKVPNNTFTTASSNSESEASTSAKAASVNDTKMIPIVQKNLRDLGLIPDGDRYQAIVKRFTGSFGFATIQNGPHTGVDVLVHQNELITSEDGVFRKLTPGDYIECMVKQQRTTSDNNTDNETSTTSATSGESGQTRLCASYVTGPNAGLLRCEILHQRNNRAPNSARKYPLTHRYNKTQNYSRGRGGRGGSYRGRGRQVIVHHHYHGMTNPPTSDK